MDNLQISFLEKGDIEKAANVLSLAMLSNPLHVAVFQGQGESQRQEIEKMFSGLLQENPGITFVACLNGEMVGVMRMKSCDGSRVLDDNADIGDINSLTWRKSVWHREWARHDPLDQHWHLGPIGVLPSCQGKGAGSKLMNRFCHEVDACSAAAYLETDLDKNVKFYEKFGFKLVEEGDILGVASRYMLREPKQ